MTQDYTRLTIEQTDASTKIIGASGHLLAVYFADDQSKSNSTNDATASATLGQWQGSQFVVTTQDERRGKTTRTYELSSDGKQLNVTTRIDNPRFNQPVKFRFVYDPVKSSGDSSQ